MAKNTKNIINPLFSVVAVVLAAVIVIVAGTRPVFADCEPNYGGGETCIFNKSFKITKEVRIKDEDDDWEKKVTDVKKDETVEFRIKVKNVGEVEVDNMKIRDILPDELERTGGDGLTEIWDDFEPDETKEFIIRAKIDEDEFDRDNFEKCVVNKVELFFDGDFEGSDTAIVCYEKGEIKELPSTGAESTLAMGIAGLEMIVGGIVTKKRLS